MSCTNNCFTSFFLHESKLLANQLSLVIGGLLSAVCFAQTEQISNKLA
jgi:hypothetical protein